MEYSYWTVSANHAGRASYCVTRVELSWLIMKADAKVGEEKCHFRKKEESTYRLSTWKFVVQPMKEMQLFPTIRIQITN